MQVGGFPTFPSPMAVEASSSWLCNMFGIEDDDDIPYWIFPEERDRVLRRNNRDEMQRMYDAILQQVTLWRQDNVIPEDAVDGVSSIADEVKE